MEGKITIEAEATKEVTAVTLSMDFFKSKTKITYGWDKKSMAGVDILKLAKADIKRAFGGDEKVKTVMFELAGAKSGGRLINRTTIAFEKIGIVVSDLPDWKDDSFSVTLKGDITTGDIPILITTLILLGDRASRTMGHTQHPLTVFDLKQAAGIVYGAKIGDKQAIELMKWFGVREDASKEEKKVTKKAQSKAKKEAGTISKNSSEAAPGKKGKAASLTSLAA